MDKLKEELAAEKLKLSQVEEKMAKYEKTESELEALRKDQESLLELLAEQEGKLQEFKNKLRKLGEKVYEKFSHFFLSLFLMAFSHSLMKISG